MRKKTILLSVALVSTQMAGCSAVKNYIFKPVEVISSDLVMQYNFIKPRRLALPEAQRTKLEASIQNRFNYYSASGHSCRTLSLNTKQSACNINGQWQVLAPILNTTQPL